MTTEEFDLTPLQSARVEQLRRRDRLGLPFPVPHSPGAILHVVGDVDRSLLVDALTAVVDRQAALRTHLRLDLRSPTQVVGPVTVACAEISLTGQTSVQQWDNALAVLARRCAYEFDPGRSMFDVATARIGPDETVLLLRADHLVADLWSLNVVLEDLCRAYGAATGTVGPPAPLAAGYADVVREDSAWLDSDAGHEARRDCADIVTAVEPFVLPHPAADTITSTDLSEQSWLMHPTRVATLTQRCRGARTTIGTALLTALGASLATALNLPAVSVLVVFTGRDNSRLRSLVAFRTNTVPVRIPAPTGRPMRELLPIVHRANFVAMASQSVPWPVMMRDHGLAVGRDGMPPVPVALQYIPSDLGVLDDSLAGKAFGGVEVRSRFGTMCPTGAPLDVQVSDGVEGLRVTFQFVDSLVDRGFVDDVRLLFEQHLLELAGD